MLIRESTLESFAEAEREFDMCWRDPAATHLELAAVDVNRTLGANYSMSPPVDLTRAMVWDMELKKAWDPATYIPSVVSTGVSWGRHLLGDGCEHFVRASMQKPWLGGNSGQVIESVFVSASAQRILFLGLATATTTDGHSLTASTFQPLFHVEHSVGGTQSRPLNVWRIVVLTSARDIGYVRSIKEMMTTNRLPEYLEIYIKNDLNIALNTI